MHRSTLIRTICGAALLCTTYALLRPISRRRAEVRRLFAGLDGEAPTLTPEDLADVFVEEIIDDEPNQSTHALP